MTRTIELWFDFASTYSYLAASRVEAMAEAAGFRLVWRPFLLGPIFQAQLGYADSPFSRNPVRGRYMWRDLERRAAKLGVPFRKPSVFPRNSLLAARVALLVEDEPWMGRFVRSVFAANFAENRDIASPEVIRELAPEALVERAADEPVKRRLRERVDEAVARGIFGAPTLFVEREMFFGDDRLEDALAWS